MKFLLTILFPLFSMAQSQAVIQQEDTVLSVSQGSLPLTACVSYCGNPSSYVWSNVAGNPVIFASQGAKSTIISGFKVGISRIAFTVNGSSKAASDTLTLAFSAPIPIPPVPIPCPICPTCPIPVPCPPIPKQRTVVSIQETTTSTKQSITITYDDGSISVLQ